MSEAAVLPINELANPRAVIGGNLPPLAEQLAEEIAPLAAEVEELVAVAVTAKIADDEGAAKVAIVIAKLRDQEKALDAARTERKRPYLEASRLIDAAYGAPIRRLAVVRAGEDGRGGLGAILTQWKRRREEAARAERERLAAEQRAREAEAERARQAAEEARAAGQGGLAAELDAIKKQEEADRLARQAETLRPEPIRTPVGNVGSRRETVVKIIDLRKCLGWILKQPGGAGAATQFAKTWLGPYLRGIGVAAVERGDAQIPGVELSVDTRAQVQ